MTQLPSSGDHQVTAPVASDVQQRVRAWAPTNLGSGNPAMLIATLNETTAALVIEAIRDRCGSKVAIFNIVEATTFLLAIANKLEIDLLDLVAQKVSK